MHTHIYMDLFLWEINNGNELFVANLARKCKFSVGKRKTGAPKDKYLCVIYVYVFEL